jgi:hypothetical protein
MSAWTSFVTKYYNDKKKTTPGYQFKSAMRDAAKVYKKNTPSAEGSTPTRKRSMSRKSRPRSRRTRRMR